MNYEIVYLPLAENDLLQIDLYLSQFYENTAARVFAELERRIAALQDMPKQHEAYAENPFYRRLVSGDYLVFYHIDEARKRVEVHRILRGAYDIARYLQTQKDKEV